MTKLICIIGTDGSGKTTLADAVVDALNEQGTLSRRVWLGAESVIMAPVRKLLRLVWRSGKRSDSSGAATSGPSRADSGYKDEIARKNALVRRYPWAARAYISLVWLDYRLQIAVKRWRNRDCDVIVADRYLFDVAVNIGLTLGWSPDQVVRLCRRWLGGLPLPQVCVFLRVTPEVSMRRKDDIPDIAYLRLRFSYYDAVAKAFGFVERSGTLRVSENRDCLLQEVARNRPYILYVHSNNTDVGGADKVLALMADHMRASCPDAGVGNRVAVCLRLQTPIADRYARDGIPVIQHDFVRPQLSKGVRGLFAQALRAPASLWFFWRLFRREHPEIVHVNDLYDVIPAVAAKLCGIPVVWHIRMIKTTPIVRSVFAWLISRTSQISVSVSRAVRDHYFPVQVPGHRALVIHDLGNADLVADNRDTSRAIPAPPGVPANGPLVVMVGRIEPWKGQHVFVEAVAHLPETLRKSATFALVGGGVQAKESYFDEVTAKARNAGIAVLGQRDDVPEILRAADISVHCSVAPDPFPGVVIESLLAGAATIAARSGGAVEMIEDGVNGRLTEPGNVTALTDALTELLSSAQSPREKFGAAARERALALVDTGVVDAAVEDVYRNLVAPRAGIAA